MMHAKIAMHVHSNWSFDGHWTVPRLAGLARLLGVNVLMMSEHSQHFSADALKAYKDACAAVSTPQLRVLPGIEYSSPDNEVHLLTWGIDEFLGEELAVETILHAAREHDAFTVLAHPARRDAWKKVTKTWARDLDAIEIWNRKVNGSKPCAHALDLCQRFGLPGAVGIDFHRAKHLYPLINRAEMSSETLQQSNDEIIGYLKSQRLQPQAWGKDVTALADIDTSTPIGVGKV